MTLYYKHKHTYTHTHIYIYKVVKSKIQNIPQQIVNQYTKYSTRQKSPTKLPHWFSNTLFLDIIQQNGTYRGNQQDIQNSNLFRTGIKHNKKTKKYNNNNPCYHTKDNSQL